jgi:hypothetical protein
MWDVHSLLILNKSSKMNHKVYNNLCDLKVSKESIHYYKI